MGNFSTDFLNYFMLYSSKNKYKDNKPSLEVNGRVYSGSDYGRILAEYVKYRTQYNQLMESIDDTKKTIRAYEKFRDFSKGLINDEKDERIKKDYERGLKESIQQIEITKKQLKKLQDTVSPVSGKMRMFGQQLDKYKGEGEFFLRNGIEAGDKVKLQISDERFCEYLTMIEQDNVKLRRDEEVQKNSKEIMPKIFKDLAADFDALFPQFVGQTQFDRMKEAAINPLQRILINGKPVEEYAFSGASAEFRPKDAKGKPADLLSMLGNEGAIEYMKANVMAALVEGKDAVHVLSVKSAKDNYTLDSAKQIKLDVSAYKRLEEEWIGVNKRNFLRTKKNICVFEDKRTPEEKEKAEKELKKTIEKTTKELNVRFNKFIPDEVKKAYEIDAKNNQTIKKMKDEARKVGSDRAKSDDTYKHKVLYTNDYYLQPVDDEVKSYFEMAYTDFVSAKSKNHKNGSIGDVTWTTGALYTTYKNEAQEALKAYGLSSVYNTMILGSCTSLDKNYRVVKDMDKKRQTIDKDLASNEHEVFAMDVSSLVTQGLGIVSSVVGSVNNLKELKVGSYLDLSGNYAFETGKDNFLNPRDLSEKDRNRFYELSSSLDERLSAVKNRGIELLSHIKGTKFKPNDAFKKAYNSFLVQLDVPQIRSDYRELAELYGKMLYKNNGLDEPDARVGLRSEEYYKAASRLYHANEIIKFFSEKYIQLFFDKNSDMAKKREEQNQKIKELKERKGPYTAEEEELLEYNIDAEHNKFTQATIDFQSLSLGDDYFIKNSASKDKISNIAEIGKEFSLIYPMYYDEKILEKNRELDEQLQKENQKKAEANEPVKEVTEAEVEAVISESASSGNTEKLMSNMKLVSFKKKYDEMMFTLEKKLTAAEKNAIDEKVNERIIANLPEALQIKYREVNFNKEEKVKALVDEFVKNNKYELDTMKNNRELAQKDVEAIEDEISNTNYRLESMIEVENYWDERRKLCNDIMDLSGKLNDEKARLGELAVKVAELKPMQMGDRVDLLTKLGEEYGDMQVLLDPKGRWAEGKTINDLKLLSFVRSEVSVDKFINGTYVGVDEHKKTINKYNADRTFKIGDSLDTGVIDKPSDKHKNPKGNTLASYDKLSVDDFMMLYQEVRETYGNDKKTFLEDNPNLQARFESLFKMMDNIEAEGEKRREILEIASQNADDNANNIIEAQDKVADAEKSVKEVEGKIAEKLSEYNNNANEYVDAEIAVNGKISHEDFLKESEEIIRKIDENKLVATNKRKELQDELLEQNMRLDKALNTQKMKNTFRTVEGNYELVKYAAASYKDIRKQITKEFITNKLAKKSKELVEEKRTESKEAEKVPSLDDRLAELNSAYNKKRTAIPASANNEPRMVASVVNSQDFIKYMGALYEMSELKTYPGHNVDNYKFIAERRDKMYEAYGKVCDALNSKSVLKEDIKSGNLKLKSKNDLKQHMALRYEYNNKGGMVVNGFVSKSVPDNIKDLVNSKCNPMDYSALFTVVYPEVSNYLQTYKEVKKFLKENEIFQNVGEGNEKDVVNILKDIKDTRKNVKDPKTKVKYQDTPQGKKMLKLDMLLEKYAGKGEKDKNNFLRDIIVEPQKKYDETDLVYLENVCTDLANTEMELLVKSVENVLMENKVKLMDIHMKEQMKNVNVDMK